MNVLLVEDNAVLGEAFRDHVVVNGHQVRWCLNLKDAVAALKGFNFDLILLDRRLPDGDGLSLLRTLRRTGRIPVIILTAYDTVSDMIEGLDSGADDVLVKPFDLCELISRMEMVTKWRAPTRPDHR